MELKYNGKYHVVDLPCEFDSREYQGGGLPVCQYGEGEFPTHISMWVDVKSSMGSENLDGLLRISDTVTLRSGEWEMSVRHSKPVETHDSHGLCCRLSGPVVEVLSPSKLDVVLAEP